ncbi:MAG: glycosyltransferase family 2 protein [Bacteroidetes bacterium]|nr:glycosyltransferase family 2 protein [Bacteroidota bacterium]
MEKPLVSVLMTAYNREKFIAQAIESVQASTYQNFELIIVDDGSKDQTVAIAKQYAAGDPRIQVHINEKNLGDYPNRNRAATYAKGEYLKYLDSDDLLYPHGLEAFVYFMQKDPEVAMGISFKKNITEQPFPMIMGPKESIRYHFFTDGFLDCAPTGTIIRRDCFEQVGGFSGKRMIGDLEFGLKIASQHKVMLVPPALFYWRNHGDQEVFIGINGNMYPKLYKQVLQELGSELSDLLTASEMETILKSANRHSQMVGVKHVFKKILGKK